MCVCLACEVASCLIRCSLSVMVAEKRSVCLFSGSAVQMVCSCLSNLPSIKRSASSSTKNLILQQWKVRVLFVYPLCLSICLLVCLSVWLVIIHRAGKTRDNILTHTHTHTHTFTYSQSYQPIMESDCVMGHCTTPQKLSHTTVSPTHPQQGSTAHTSTPLPLHNVTVP